MILERRADLSSSVVGLRRRSSLVRVWRRMPRAVTSLCLCCVRACNRAVPRSRVQESARRLLAARPIDAHDLPLAQAELSPPPLARARAQPPLPLVRPLGLPLLLETERLPPLSPRSLLRAGPVTSRGVALLRPLEVGGVLSLAEQPGRVLRQRGVALKGLGGREGQLPQEVRQRGVGAGREGLDERREVRVELGEVPEGRGV